MGRTGASYLGSGDVHELCNAAALDQVFLEVNRIDEALGSRTGKEPTACWVSPSCQRPRVENIHGKAMQGIVGADAIES